MATRSLSPSSRSRLKMAGLAVVTLVATPVGAGIAQASAAPLRVVGLGDSVMAAGGCPSCESFVNTAGHRIATARHQRAAISNYATGGYRSVDVLHQLQDPSVRSAVGRSDVTVIEVGANDFKESSAHNPDCEPAVAAQCFTHPAATMAANLSLIVSRVKQLQQRPGAQVVLMGYWNVFKDGRVGRSQGSTYVNVSTQLTRWVNSMTWQVAKQQGVRYVDAYQPMKRAGDATRYLVADGDHPNAAGHAVLADALATSLGD